MRELPRIAMLWVEGPLSFLEQLCVKSFLDAGHHVTLYHYGPVTGAPEGTEMVHGDAVLARGDFIAHSRTGSVALFSDVFRYHLLTKFENVIWADTDAYCVKPFRTETGHYFGWESETHINGGVLGLPQDSPALASLLEMTEDEYGIPFWYQGADRRQLEEARDAGAPVHVADMSWGVWGPHAVTNHLKRSGEDAHALPREVLYPVPYKRRRSMVREGLAEKAERFLTEDTTSIHLYGRRTRQFIGSKTGGLPAEGSLIEALLRRHGIDPREAPVVAKQIGQAEAA